MRILLASWTSRQAGGAETYAGRIIGLLASAGCEVAFAYEVEEPESRPQIPLPPGAPMFQLAGPDGESGFRAAREWRPDVIFAQGLLDPSIEERLQSIAPAVLFAHSYYGTCISGDKTHKLPIVQPCDRSFGPGCLALYYPRRCGGLNPLTMIREYSRQQRRLSLLARYAAVVTASEHMRRELARHGAAGGHVFTCAMPLERAEGQVARAAGAAHDPGAPHRLVFVGRMDRLKGGMYLLDALPLVRPSVQRPVHLTFAGDGPDRTRWERHAQDVMRRAAGVRVEFAGWLGQEDVASLLDVSDLMVMPSLWPEPYGLAGVEASARGLPVVAYATGGIPEWLIEGSTGCLAPANPPTVEGLADAIRRCLAQLPSLRQRALAAGGSAPADRHVDELLPVLRKAAVHAHRIAPAGARRDR